MSESRGDTQVPDLQRRAIELTVRLLVVGLLVYWCFAIFRPFLMLLVWGIVLAVALHPVHARIERVFRGRRRLAAILLLLLCACAVVVPAVLLSSSLVDGVRFVKSNMEAGNLKIPPPPENVAQWPLVGPFVYETWHRASTSLSAVLQPFKSQLMALGSWVLVLAKDAMLTVLLTAVSLVIAAILLVRREVAAQAALGIGARLGGEHGIETVRLAGGTIGAVAKGVVGVAAIQAAMAAVGLVLAGVPGAGLWTLLVLILAVAQLPSLLVLAPVILYLIATHAGTVTIVLFTAWTIVILFSDNVLKPLLLGRGAGVPVLVILIGAIGGLLLHGLIGLFLGAVVFSTGYRLFGQWMKQNAEAGGEPGTRP